jgi:hypothetical protein
MSAAKRKTDPYAPILGGFVPFAALWDEGATSPLFPSESSARWFVRAHRAELVRDQALALHAGRMLVHRERFEAVAQRIAIRAVTVCPTSGADSAPGTSLSRTESTRCPTS